MKWCGIISTRLGKYTLIAACEIEAKDLAEAVVAILALHGNCSTVQIYPNTVSTPQEYLEWLKRDGNSSCIINKEWVVVRDRNSWVVASSKTKAYELLLLLLHNEPGQSCLMHREPKEFHITWDKEGT